MAAETTVMDNIKRRFEEDVPEVNYSALVIDDDPDVRTYINRVLDEFGLEVHQAEELAPAGALLTQNSYCMVFIDKRLPDGDGVEFSKFLLSKYKGLPIVIITGEGSGEEAAESLDSGVFDYIPKPCTPGEVRDVVNKILYRYLSRKEAKSAPISPAPAKKDGVPAMVGKSRQMVEVGKQVLRFAQMDRPVLIQGATGTGKEVVARRIHHWSAQSKKDFVAVNCGAIPSELIESELFGSVKGAFTGAIERKGLFEAAQGGTIFLDEITETSLAFQVKLLRVLQEGTIRPVGSTTEKKLDVRVIAASNRNIRDEVAAGRFREDLYYRLKGSEINLPLLKDRTRDIMELAEHFAGLYNRYVIFSEQVEEALQAYDWPGNVRELESVIDVAVRSCDGEVLMCDLPVDLRLAVGDVVDGDEKRVIGAARRFLPLDEMEVRYILRVLKANNGNKSQAAKELGINRHTINVKLGGKGGGGKAAAITAE